MFAEKLSDLPFIQQKDTAVSELTIKIGKKENPSQRLIYFQIKSGHRGKY